MTRKIIITSLATLVCAAGLAYTPAASARSDLDCRLDYQLDGWSLIYKRAEGSGVVRCENGQTLPVRISAKALGITAGKWRIDNGNGHFTDVHNIHDVYGRYLQGSANAGLIKSAETQLVTKGDVSLALAGSGDGVNLGVDIGAFHIKPAR